MDFPDAKNRQRHVKYLLNACVTGALVKTLILSTVSHRQSSGASLWGGNWASKLPAVICIRLYGAALKREIPAPRGSTWSAMSLSKCSREIVQQWIPGHCGVTGNELADEKGKLLNEKGSFHSTENKESCPIIIAKHIIKEMMNDLTPIQYTN
ncbi:hypothetical protein TNCV_702771 [Trichonephila clavipes]|nr:hypothetical protein TNCV_702771 [Trichonephila clavipes]